MPETLTLKMPENLRGCANTPSALIVEKIIGMNPGDTLVVEGYEKTYSSRLAVELLRASGLEILELTRSPDGRYVIRAILP